MPLACLTTFGEFYFDALFLRVICTSFCSLLVPNARSKIKSKQLYGPSDLRLPSLEQADTVHLRDRQPDRVVGVDKGSVNPMQSGIPKEFSNYPFRRSTLERIFREV